MYLIVNRPLKTSLSFNLNLLKLRVKAMAVLTIWELEGPTHLPWIHSQPNR